MGKKKRLKQEKALQAAEQTKPKEKKERRPLSAGVVIFGVLLILSTLSHMHKLVTEKQWYLDTYSYLPGGLTIVRYSFSWLQRVLGLIAGVGILARKEFARKLAFLIGAFTVLTVYWKHPYEAVARHTHYLDTTQAGQILSATGTGITFSSITPYAVAGLIACDIIFWAIFFIFFTRPSVRRQFRPDIPKPR